MLEERPGSDLVGWRYAGPFDDLAAVRDAFARGTRDAPDVPYEHRVIAWTEVGEEEGTGIVHIAPGCGAEDFQLGRELGLPVIAPLDESGIVVDGFGSLTGRDVRDVAEPIVEHLKREGRFYRLETIVHRYPHCWRCNTPLVFRLVDEWYISMGPVYDQPRETLTKEQVDASLRYQIMEIVDQIRWIPGFGYDRELDWLLNMHDWMISKKRYYGLALPIYDCSACGTFDVIGGREELKARAVAGWETFEGHTPHRPYVDAVTIACPGCGAPVERIRDVGNPWLDAGIVPFSTLHYREDREYWSHWFPADFITESFPGQFRNWFYSMLAMGTVLRREPPFKAIFGYATLFGEDGRPMHKSWGNAIDFDEAAERMGVDVMRWMYCSRAAGGQHPVRLARRGRGAPRAARPVERATRSSSTYARLGRLDAGCRRPARDGRAAVAERSALDRWILSRAAGTAARVGDRLADYDAREATRRDRRLHRRPLDLVPAPLAAPALAGRGRARPRRRVRDASRRARRRWPASLAPDPAVHGRGHVPQPRRRRGPRRAGQRPPDALAGRRAGAAARRARWRPRWRPPGARSSSPGRSAAGAGLRVRQPLARLWLALPGGDLAGARRPPGAHRRRGQRQGDRAHRRRVGARGPAGEAAAAADRQAPGRRDPGRDGRRAGGRGRVPRRTAGVRLAGDHPGCRRGRDPGDAATGHGGRPRRGPRGGHRHGADARAAGRGRRARALARRPGPAQATPAWS